MPIRATLGLIALAAALYPVLAAAQPVDDARYPDWKGQWARIGDARWDIGKPRHAQEAPLTTEYQAKLQASIDEQAAGGQGNDMMSKCYPPGMPRMMIAYNPLAFAITPDITYVLLEHMSQHRRIYTDGRNWPEHPLRTFVGTSIGRWIDEDGDGRFATLSVETRDIGGPRAFDSSGLPLHDDGETIVKERIFLDKTDKNILRDELTTIDHALTRPWTVTRSYHREAKPIWSEHICSEENHQVWIGGEHYFLSGDGTLMPARKDQPPPDLRNFTAVAK